MQLICLFSLPDLSSTIECITILRPIMLHPRKFDLGPLESTFGKPKDEALGVDNGVLSFLDVVFRIKSVLRQLESDPGPKNTLLRGDVSDLDQAQQDHNSIGSGKCDTTSKDFAQKNCPKPCFNQSTLFASMETLASCVTVGTAAVLYQIDPTVLDLSQASHTIASDMGKLGVTNLGHFDGARVLQDLV